MNKVIVLLSTYNGEKYLKEQLNSLFSQSYEKFEIIARDDGSSDNTLNILNSFNIKILKFNKNLGAKTSFIKLLAYATENTKSDYFMFCDQDDIWEKDKIEKTIKKILVMEKEFKNIPLLVHTDLEVVDDNLNLINSSLMDFQKINFQKDEFPNLLMQNTITGCSVMINRNLAKKSLTIPKDAIMHDWWLGLIASKFGKIGYVNDSTIKYRQHTSNAVGAKGFDIFFVFKSIFKRLLLSENILQANAFLKQFEYELDAETKRMLKEFTTLEDKKVLKKWLILWKYKLLKQGFIRNVALFLKI